MRASTWQSLTVSFAACVLTACTSNPLDPGSGDALGSGTQTLRVEGATSASPQIANASADNDFDTEFDFRLTKNQVQVDTGTVTVTSNGGAVDLTYDTADGGHWVGHQAGYYEVYQLDVTSGGDTISGVIVDGPDIHSFTAPTLGATVDTSQAVDVAWSRGDHADEAVIWTDQLDHTTIDDAGTYSLPANGLKSSKDKVENDTIRLRRTNRVSPAGAVAGSEVAVTVSNDLDVVVAINPNAP